MQPNARSSARRAPAGSALRSALGRIAITMALCSTTAQAQTWTTFKSTADRFEVEFSGNVTTSPTPLGDEAMKRTERSTNYEAGDDPAFAINATLAKFSINFAGGVHDSFASLKCKTTTNDQSLPFPQGQARTLSGEGCVDGEHSALVRYFVVDKWFYQVIALFRPSDEATARHFVESFNVLPQ